MNKFLYIITYPFRLIVIGLIYFYKKCISPLLTGNHCRFTPSCSTYTLIAINEWGLVKGCYLGIKRILRCNPFSRGGLDRVPYNLKGDKKWIF